MEKHGAIVAKSKFKFLMLLPKPTSTSATAVNLYNQNQNPNYLFSPARASVKSRQCPITSVVFQEARNKSSNGPGSSSRFTKEPTSPKISCMGQIKSRKKNKSKKDGFSKTDLLQKDAVLEPKKKKKAGENRAKTGENRAKTGENRGRNPFSRGKQGKKLSEAQSDSEKDAKPSSKIPDRAPSLSQMKRFASARDTFSKFDYSKAQIAPENRDPGYYSEQSSGEDEEEEREEPMIPFSAPILRGGYEGVCSSKELQPRKEINLWKRRTMVQPKPLQIH